MKYFEMLKKSPKHIARSVPTKKHYCNTTVQAPSFGISEVHVATVLSTYQTSTETYGDVVRKVFVPNESQQLL